MKTALFTATLWLGALGVTALAEGTPKIQFERTVYDFGSTSRVATVSGVFKFKNAGDGLLKIEPPKPTCGCTFAELKPDTLAPGPVGEAHRGQDGSAGHCPRLQTVMGVLSA